MTTRATGSSSTSRWPDERHRRQGHRRLDFLVDAVQQIPSDSWDLPSNLDGWSIRDLVVHTTGSAAKLVTLRGWRNLPAVRAGDRRSAHSSRRTAEGRSRGRGPRCAAAGTEFPIVGLTIHGWDVYRSQRRRSSFPTTCSRFAVSSPSRARDSCADRWIRAGPAGARGRHADCPAHGLFPAFACVTDSATDTQCTTLASHVSYHFSLSSRKHIPSQS